MIDFNTKESMDYIGNRWTNIKEVCVYVCKKDDDWEFLNEILCC